MNKFLDVRCLTRYQSQGHDTADVHIWAIHMHVQLELLANGFDVLESLLIVGPSAADIYLRLVFDQRRRKFPQGTDDTLEC